MLGTWLVLSALCAMHSEAEFNCGPNVVPMTIKDDNQCSLRASRDMLNATDADLSATVERGLTNGLQLMERLKTHERRVAGLRRVRLYTPEYHHYLTNAPANATIQSVVAGLEDLANSTAVVRQLAYEYGIPLEAAGDFLISLKIEANPSKVTPIPECDETSIYRTHDGSCNNLQYPTWGMTNSAFTRLAKSRFYDGTNVPRKSVSGKELPNARILRLHLMPTGFMNDDTNTLMVMQFGQLIAHDTSFSGDQFGIDGLGILCCSNTSSPVECQDLSIACLPVEIAGNDPFYAAKGSSCMSVVRSTKTYTLAGYLGPAETVNSVNHFLDASFIHGFDKERADELRTFTGGRLKGQTLADGRDVLSQADDPVESCSLRSSNQTCFLAGDNRVNQNTQLSVLQILMQREHNRKADELSAINPLWDDERTYQEARKLVGAEFAQIVYEEYLPQIMDEELLEEHGLKPPKTGFSGSYNSSVNPSTLHEFTESIFRIFHGMAQSDLKFYKHAGCPVGAIKLGSWMDKPEIIVQDDHLDQLTLGLTKQPAMKDNKYTNSELNRNLFRTDAEYGQDLDTLDIMRARDSGLESYNFYRELIGLQRATKFEDFSDTIPYEDTVTLSRLYEHPDDVDLMVAMLEKRKTPGLTVMKAIILDQFKRWKNGDRMFYDIGNATHSFTEDQINEVRKASMSRIICDNADNITQIQPNSFKKVAQGNELTDCPLLPSVDLSHWREETGLQPQEK